MEIHLSVIEVGIQRFSIRSACRVVAFATRRFNKLTISVCLLACSSFFGSLNGQGNLDTVPDCPIHGSSSMRNRTGPCKCSYVASNSSYSSSSTTNSWDALNRKMQREREESAARARQRQQALLDQQKRDMEALQQQAARINENVKNRFEQKSGSGRSSNSGYTGGHGPCSVHGSAHYDMDCSRHYNRPIYEPRQPSAAELRREREQLEALAQQRQLEAAEVARLAEVKRLENVERQRFQAGGYLSESYYAELSSFSSSFGQSGPQYWSDGLGGSFLIENGQNSSARPPSELAQSTSNPRWPFKSQAEYQREFDALVAQKIIPPGYQYDGAGGIEPDPTLKSIYGFYPEDYEDDAYSGSDAKTDVVLDYLSSRAFQDGSTDAFYDLFNYAFNDEWPYNGPEDVLPIEVREIVYEETARKRREEAQVFPAGFEVTEAELERQAQFLEKELNGEAPDWDSFLNEE